MFSYRSILLCLSVLASVSCKKETEYAPYPYNEVLSLKINAGGGDKINAAVAGDSLVVYWPSYLARPAKISPEISISDKATITPASGTEVDFTTGTKFSVKAQNGAVKDYFLKVVVNQPPIQIAEQTFTTYQTTKGGTYSFDNGTNARYIIRDAAVSHFYLVDSSNVEYELPLQFPEGMQNMIVTVPDESKFKIGGYRIKVVSGAQTAITNDYVFGIIYPASMKGVATALTTSISTKRGQNITFAGTGFFEMKDAAVVTFNANGSEIALGKLEIVSFTATSVTYKVPADFPIGTWKLNVSNTTGANIKLRTSDFVGSWSWSGATPVYIYVGAPGDGSVSFSVTE